MKYLYATLIPFLFFFMTTAHAKTSDFKPLLSYGQGDLTKKCLYDDNGIPLCDRDLVVTKSLKINTERRILKIDDVDAESGVIIAYWAGCWNKCKPIELTAKEVFGEVKCAFSERAEAYVCRGYNALLNSVDKVWRVGPVFSNGSVFLMRDRKVSPMGNILSFIFGAAADKVRHVNKVSHVLDQYYRH